MMPQHRKRGFNPLPDRRQAAISLSGILFCNQQTLVFFKQFVLQSRAAISQIADHGSKTQKFSQSFGNRAVGIIARCQNAAANLLLGGCQNVQLKTEKPTFRRFPEICAVITKQPDPAMTCRLTHGNRFGVHQIDAAPVKRSRSFKEFLHYGDEPMQTTNELFVTAKSGKLRRKILFNQRKGFAQAFHAELTLHQGDRQNLRVRERRTIVITAPPVGNLRILLQKIINKAVDFTQFIKYLFHWLSKKANRFSWSNVYFTTLYSDNLLFFQIATGVKV